MLRFITKHLIIIIHLQGLGGIQAELKARFYQGDFHHGYFLVPRCGKRMKAGDRFVHLAHTSACSPQGQTPDLHSDSNRPF